MMRRTQQGFSLIELAVVVFIIALLLGSILVPLSTQIEQRQISDTHKILDDIKEALVGFAIANGHLPCPDKMSGSSTPPNDVPNDGNEDFSAAGTCIVPEGNLPWTALGVGHTDSWGNRFRYRVDPDFAQRSPAATFSISTAASVRVCTTAACTVFLTSDTPNGAAAIILSHGKNGSGAINSLTNSQNPQPPVTNLDELQNTDANVNFVSRVATPAGTPAGEFDDIVSWLSKYTLFNRMVAAGKLP